MKLVPLYFARVPDPIRPGRMYKTRHRMVREDIVRRGGVVLEDTVEIREVAETDEERDRRTPTSPAWNAAGQFAKPGTPN